MYLPLSTLILVIANLFPLYGIAYWGWDALGSLMPLILLIVLKTLAELCLSGLPPGPDGTVAWAGRQ